MTLRDGIQNEKFPVLPTQLKVQLAQQFYEAGFKHIELASFTGSKHPYAFKFSDNEEVLRQLQEVESIKADSKLKLVALVPPNIHLYNRAVKAGYKHIATFLSANKIHHQSNTNGKTIENSLQQIKKISEQSIKDDVWLRAYIVTAFGYLKPEDVPIEHLQHIEEELLSVYDKEKKNACNTRNILRGYNKYS